MNLLFCCEFYYPSVGGVQEVMRQIAERMVERGHSVTVATTRLRSRAFREWNGVRIAEFSIAGNAVRGLSGDIDAYRKFVANEGFDLIFIKAAQQWTLDALVPVFPNLKMRKVFVPCGFSALYDPAYADYFLQMPDILRQFDQLVFYASEYRDIEFARVHGLTKIAIVPNGASEREFNVPRDPSFRQRNGIPEGALVLLTVGSLSGYKGHQEIADAFSRADFAGRQATLLLNGNRPESQNLVRKIIASLKTIYRKGREKGFFSTSRFILDELRRRYSRGSVRAESTRVGFAKVKELEASLAETNRPGSGKRAMLIDFPRSELIQAYLNSDLFVFASNIEYSPLVLFEASAAGLPFLSVPVGNAEEIAQWTGGGEICPANLDRHGYTHVDPQTLAEHIQRLVANPGLLKSYGESGRRNWSERFTWEKIADRYEQLFLRTLSGDTRNAGSPS